MSHAAADAGTLRPGNALTVNQPGFGAMRIAGDGIRGEPDDREGAKEVPRRIPAPGIGLDEVSGRRDARTDLTGPAPRQERRGGRRAE